jgi:hypothetical protein
MAIDVEVSRAAVSTSSHDVGELAECGKIVGGVERETVVKSESLAVRD